MFKYLAALFMLIDHIAFYLSDRIPPDTFYIMRQIGRLAFPMFAYIIAKNINRTSHLPRYFMRLLIAASVTQLIFQALHVIYTDIYIYVNTLFTFALGVALVTGIRLVIESSRDMLLMARPVTNLGDKADGVPPQIQIPVNFGGITLPAWSGLLFGVVLIAISLVTTWFINPDYGLYGVIMIPAFYYLNKMLPDDSGPLGKENRLPRTLGFFAGLLVLNLLYYWNMSSRGMPFGGRFQMFSTLAAILFPMESISERRPGKFSKRFFYIFYPAHIAILMIMSHYTS